MKILFFTQYFWPENFRINELIKFFTSSKYKNIVLTAYPSYPSKKYFKEFKISDDNKFLNERIIRIPVIPRYTNNFFLILNYLSFFIASFFYSLSVLYKTKFKILFLFCPSPIYSVLPIILVNKLFKVKTVLWVLDLWPDTIIDLKKIKNKYLINFLKKIVKYIYNNSDLILAQSNSMKIEIEKITKNKCIFFPSWPEEGIGESNIQYSKALNKKNSDVTRIMFTGNIGEAQSFITLIEAAKILKTSAKIEWIIIGDGRFKKELKKLIEINNLQKEFILIKPVPLSSIKSYFNHADALYLSLQNNSTYQKTIPGKLQTYMSAQKPIIASISGEAKEIIENSSAGFASDAEDITGLVNNVIKFINLTDKQKYDLGNNAKVFCDKNYVKENILNDLKRNLEDLIKKQ